MATKLRILAVVEGIYPDAIGGAHTYQYELFRHLAAAGHEVHVVTRRLHAGDADSELIEGFVVHRCDVPGMENPLLWRFFASGACYTMARRACARFQPDLVHIFYMHGGLKCARHASQAGLPVVVTCHAPCHEDELVEARGHAKLNPGLRTLIKSAYLPVSLFEKKRTERKMIKMADTMILLSDFVRERLIEIHGQHLVNAWVIPGGVDTNRFKPPKSKAQAKERLGLPQDRRILLTVRRLVHRMGLENLIGAMVNVRQILPDVQLIIGGTGQLKGLLDEQIRASGLQDCIKLAGFIPNDKLADYYGAADLFVLPTQELEGFGLVTLEAMACGTPALGTPVGGTVDLLSGFDSRCLCPDSSASGISEGIVRLMSNFRTFQDLTSRTRPFVENGYSWDRIADMVEGVYFDMIRQVSEQCV